MGLVRTQEFLGSKSEVYTWLAPRLIQISNLSLKTGKDIIISHFISNVCWFLHFQCTRRNLNRVQWHGIWTKLWGLFCDGSDFSHKLNFITAGNLKIKINSNSPIPTYHQWRMQCILATLLPCQVALRCYVIPSPPCSLSALISTSEGSCRGCFIMLM